MHPQSLAFHTKWLTDQIQVTVSDEFRSACEGDSSSNMLKQIYGALIAARSFGQSPKHMRQRMVPGLAIRLGQVDLGPRAGFHERLGCVPAELTAIKHFWPEEVDESYLHVFSLSLTHPKPSGKEALTLIYPHRQPRLAKRPALAPHMLIHKPSPAGLQIPEKLADVPFRFRDAAETQHRHDAVHAAALHFPRRL